MLTCEVGIPCIGMGFSMVGPYEKKSSWGFETGWLKDDVDFQTPTSQQKNKTKPCCTNNYRIGWCFIVEKSSVDVKLPRLNACMSATYSSIWSDILEVHWKSYQQFPGSLENDRFWQCCCLTCTCLQQLRGQRADNLQIVHSSGSFLIPKQQHNEVYKPSNVDEHHQVVKHFNFLHKKLPPPPPRCPLQSLHKFN